jgi:hypothetical protein
MITNDAGCACDMISKTALSKAALNKKKTPFASKLGLDLRKKIVNCYIPSMVLDFGHFGKRPELPEKF